MNIKTLSDVDLEGRRVMIREDLNVPIDHDAQPPRISSDARIRAALPTIREVLAAGSAVILVSHLGRPTEGEFDPRYSLAPVAERLSELLEQPVTLVSDWLEGVNVAPGEVVLCENVRFLAGEKANDEDLARRMASLCDVFVMDAFGTAHRAQASTEGVIHHAGVACAGPLLMAELEALERGLNQAERPIMAIVGGAKVSTKLTVLEALLERIDQLIVGGGIANTFLAASGRSVGQSLMEEDLLDDARRLMQMARDRHTEIPLPRDVKVASHFAADAEARTVAAGAVADDDMILDIGPETARLYATLIRSARTVIWNGPVGVFEFPGFADGTRTIAEAVASSDAYSIAGGGDTLAAIDQFGVGAGVSYISTGGGAFLEFVEGKTLPAVAALESRA